MNRSSRPTLATLARDLGVSRSTVSNAYNRPDQLSTELRDQILARANELGYPGPHPAARRLNSTSLTTIGVIFSERLSYPFVDPAAREFLEGLGNAAERHQLGVLLVPAPVRGPTARTSFENAIDNAVVDAIVAYSMPDHDAVLESVIAKRAPLVTVDQPTLPGVPFVGVEDRAGARAIMQHIIGLGHTRIAVVAFRLGRDGRIGKADLDRQEHAIYQVARERLGGYREAIEAAGLSWAAVHVEERPDHSIGEGREAGRALLAKKDRPSAIVAFSDVLALGVLAAAGEAGIAVPEDLSVVGFDDIDRAAEAGLTTVHQPLRTKGERVGQLLVEMWQRPGAEYAESWPCDVIVRGTSAEPRITGRSAEPS